MYLFWPFSYRISYPTLSLLILLSCCQAHSVVHAPKKHLKPTPAPSPSAAPTPTPLELFQQVKESVRTHKSYTMTQLQRERFGDKMGPVTKSQVKYLNGRVYLKMLEGPKKGAELLYGPGWNDGDVKVHKGSFPDITVNLNPYNSILLEQQHHSVEHVGFQFIIDQISNSLENCHDPSNSNLRILDSHPAGIPADSYWVEYHGPWEERKEMVRKGEDLWTFSKRVNMDPYVILHTNHLEDPDDLPEGKLVIVPRCYANRILFGIDRKTLFLDKLETFDKFGRVYESYEWKDLDINAPLTAADFDPKNPKYRF